MDQHTDDRPATEAADTSSNSSIIGGRPGRRVVLRAGAAVPVGVGLSALAACGSDESDSTADPASGADAEAGSREAAGEGFPTSEVPVGGATYDKDSETVYSQPTEGDFRAFDSTCPHQGCAVSEFTDGQMACPCHGSMFDPSTGEVTAGPATSGLTPREVTVDGGDLVLG